MGAINIMALPLYFTVQNGETATHYTSLAAAVSAAPTGSTLLIPNGSITIGTITINKKINLVGSGHYPENLGGSRTILTGTIIITLGADSGSIQGIYLNGDLKFGASGVSDSVNYYTVLRCYFNNIYLGSDEAYPNVNNVNIIECTFNDVYGYNSDNCLLNKNYILGFLRGLDYALVQNNILFNYWFSGSSWNPPLSDNCQFLFVENNIFTVNGYNSSVAFQYVSNSVFKNNLFRSITNFGNNQAINNLTNISNIFVSGVYTFDYAKSYQLTSNSPGKNYGTDGTDLGVYGTDNPSKAYAEPYIPNLSTRETASKSVNNKLPVKFSVKSQTK
jgi:hypothetical protein